MYKLTNSQAIILMQLVNKQIAYLEQLDKPNSFTLDSLKQIFDVLASSTRFGTEESPKK